MNIENKNYLGLIPLPDIQSKARPVKKTCPGQSRRKRGGQVGNHNARKHGLYSSDLTANDLTEFYQDVVTRGIEPDIALVRARLRAVLLHAPSSQRVIDDAAGWLAKIYSNKLKLGKTNTRLLKRLFVVIIESFTLVADCEKTEDISQNESSVP